mmetsp:Transcript_12874/g.32954  ORF Transcript_12874/g.32954 Transcript_12874/m.32954 type:complete len:291 (+) Transcript_12874:85-957(+)
MGSDSKHLGRTPLVARCAVLCGLIGSLLAAHATACNWPAMCHGERICTERLSLLLSAALSCWCAVASYGWAQPPPQRRATLLRCPERWVLLRSLLCGCCVALLGWVAMVGQRHLALMAVMQSNASIGAWLACEVHRGTDTRGCRSPSPVAEDREVSTPRRGSATLPRGWRYHRSTGLFEHKRTGRMQYEPPGTAETGSPLCTNLPPCDEEQTLLESGTSDGFGSDTGKDSGCEDKENSRRRSRSQTWHDGSRSVSSRKEAARKSKGHAPMNVWELRDAFVSDGARYSDAV